jgi:hypothetical protein
VGHDPAMPRYTLEDSEFVRLYEVIQTVQQFLLVSKREGELDLLRVTLNDVIGQMLRLESSREGLSQAQRTAMQLDVDAEARSMIADLLAQYMDFERQKTHLPEGQRQRRMQQLERLVAMFGPAD